jgi:alpha-amylase
MKKLLIFLSLIAISIGITACESNPVDPIDPVDPITYPLEELNPQQDVYYQIFVRSFADSNSDGIGDINGITANLDYLEDLGITALWLLPINPSPSYHGYDVIDYYDVNSDYGTLEDLENLVEQAKLRDIKIVLDLVINHTSDKHPWYLSAISSEQSPYRDYYIFNNGGAYETFVGGMKDLNLENPVVVEEVYNIVDFYLEKGIHGFRLDAARHFIEGVNADWDSTLFTMRLNAHMKQTYPESYVVSEVFVNRYEAIKDYYIGSDSLFNFPGQSNIMDKVGMENSRYLFAKSFEQIYDAYREVDPNFIDAPFLGNHDIDRLASSQGFINNDLKLKLASRILLTLPGNPFIYYGDELGMKGVRYEGTNIPGYGIVYDEYRRQPFLWGDPTYQTNWLPSDQSNDDTETLNEQINDTDSLYKAYQEMIEIRKNNPALMYGNYYKPYNGNVTQVQGYIRYYQYEDFEQAILVIHNLTPDPYTVETTYQSFILGDSLTIGGYQTIILEIDPNEIEAYI